MKTDKLDIKLRPTQISDLDTLFQFQTDKEAGYLAAFMPKDPTDKVAYLIKYTKLLVEPTVNNQTIVIDNIIVGSIAKFIMDGETEITYWIDKKFWGQGIATKALKIFVDIENSRPIFGRVVFDNFGSQKVLEKCGFVQIGSGKGFANARQIEIEELNINCLDKKNTLKHWFGKSGGVVPADTFVVNQSLIFRFNLCVENHRLRQVRNRF
ncbi:GNAT family N-acetyltransferase [Daejeonella sp.]|uniref:GNAT family N-acetyltransferase n=1 Tax=Daejeonella sp. TaxID=2805397 RepID=UPI0037852CF3